MTIRELRNEGVKTFGKAGLGRSAALDAELLVAEALGISREELLAHDERKMTSAELRRARAFIARRAKREPVAYILGRKWFCGLEFEVRRGQCLIPRPDTEVLVERAVAVAKARKPAAILDVGTGSGAIAIAVAKSVLGARMIATDISPAALLIARRNAARLGVAHRVRFAKADLLPKTLPEGPLLVLANLPYVPLAEWRTLEPEIRRYEPRRALVAGKDGLASYRRLFARLARLRPYGGFTLLAEIHPEQYPAMRSMALEHWPEAAVSRHDDLSGKTRVAEIET